jgi:hypothetical protein
VATTVVNPTFKDAPNIAAIEAVLSSHRVSARRMAIFAASQHNLLQAYALASVVPNRLVIHEEPCTRWSASALHSHPITRPRQCLPRK